VFLAWFLLYILAVHGRGDSGDCAVVCVRADTVCQPILTPALSMVAILFLSLSYFFYHCAVFLYRTLVFQFDTVSTQNLYHAEGACFILRIYIMLLFFFPIIY
jgi:hypothetical protein